MRVAQIYTILDEVYLGGEIQETSKQVSARFARIFASCSLCQVILDRLAVFAKLE